MKISAALLLTFVFLVACSTAPEDIPPETIVAKSAQTMRALDGFSFRLARSGAPVYVDPGGVVAFRAAEGSFVSPDRVQAVVKVIAPAIVAEVSVIGIGDQEWETNIFSGDWELVPPEYAFQPAVLFDPESGIHQALENFLYDVELLDVTELEEIPGLTLYHLHGKMEGSNVHVLTRALIDEQVLDIELWIEPETFKLHRVIIIDPVNEGAEEGTIWQFDFWDFGRVIEILPPA